MTVMTLLPRTVLGLLSLAALSTLPACVVDAPSEQKAVLVTGASSGIGRTIAERLASEGHFVYAGARKQADIEELNAIENIQAVRLDVTIQDDIDAAAKSISEAGRGLHGVVNNAGVMTVGALHEIPEEDLAFQFDVNVYGVYRVTKAFVPLIAESQGRIVNIGSVTGIFSEPVTGAYHMSKQAIEAYTDSLAASLASLGVEVSVIEPGRFQSNIMNSMAQRIAARERAEGADAQAPSGRLLLPNGAANRVEKPDAVADAVLHALFDANPKRRYLVVPDEATAERTIRNHLEKLVQLNAEHDFSFDRDTLVEMLDEALASENE